jgi:hypothetical protein
MKPIGQHNPNYTGGVPLWLAAAKPMRYNVAYLLPCASLELHIEIDSGFLPRKVNKA